MTQEPAKAVRELPWSTEILLEGSGGGRVMFVSGFGSGPETLRELGERLHEDRGATVLLTALARHTGDERLFFGSRAWHFFRAAERRFLEFWSGGRSPVHLGGYSTGALVALIIAARHPAKVAGLVLASPVLRTSATATQLVGYTVGSVYYVLLPVGLLASLVLLAIQSRRRDWPHRRTALGALVSACTFASAAWAMRRLRVPLRSGGGAVTRDGEQVLPPHFTRASLVSGSTLVPLQLVARWRLQNVRMPVCIVFGGEDQVVDVSFGTLQTSKSHNAELHVVPRAPHRVVSHEECHAIVSAFVDRTAREAARRASALAGVDATPLDAASTSPAPA
jgi:pimeloyl-ACP methyl ester carboxylesterase